jgi:hypothetical protein
VKRPGSAWDARSGLPLLPSIAVLRGDGRRMRCAGGWPHLAFWRLLAPPSPTPHPSRLGQGFLLMTPLRQESGGRAVMVNRGWVPAEWRQSEDMRRSGQPGGKVGLRVPFCALQQPCSSRAAPRCRCGPAPWPWSLHLFGRPCFCVVQIQLPGSPPKCPGMLPAAPPSCAPPPLLPPSSCYVLTGAA